MTHAEAVNVRARLRAAGANLASAWCSLYRENVWLYLAGPLVAHGAEYGVAVQRHDGRKPARANLWTLEAAEAEIRWLDGTPEPGDPCWCAVCNSLMDGPYCPAGPHTYATDGDRALSTCRDATDGRR